jgi:hypothetical protein
VYMACILYLWNIRSGWCSLTFLDVIKLELLADPSTILRWFRLGTWRCQVLRWSWLYEHPIWRKEIDDETSSYILYPLCPDFPITYELWLCHKNDLQQRQGSCLRPQT